MWNNFVKLGLPIVALAVLAAQGKTDTGLIGAAVISVLVLIAAVALFTLILRSGAVAFISDRVLAELCHASEP